MSSPTQRSLKHLRDNGWTACIVEKRIPFRNTTIDALGFGDILACRPVMLDCTGAQVTQIALVQTTTGAHLAARRSKIVNVVPDGEKRTVFAAEWKAAGGIILLHGWSKLGPRGKRKTWQLREEIIDFGGNEWNAQPAAAGATK